MDGDTADAALKQLSLAARMFSSASIVVKGGDAGDARADGASQQAAQDIILPAVQECLKVRGLYNLVLGLWMNVAPVILLFRLQHDIPPLWALANLAIHHVSAIVICGVGECTLHPHRCA